MKSEESEQTVVVQIWPLQFTSIVTSVKLFNISLIQFCIYVK